MRRVLIMFMSTVITVTSFSQQPSVTNWVTVQTPIVFNKKWQTLHEISYRTLGEILKLNQLFIRLGVRHTFNSKWTTGVACDFVHSRVKPYDKSDLEFGDEIRIWQEGIYRDPLGKGYFLQHRLRAEERFFGETSLGNDYKVLRLRYRLAAQKKISEKWDVQLANEYLEQYIANHWIFNSNRLSLGGYFRYAPNAHFEATYYWIRFAQQSQHVFSIAFQNRFVVKSKKKTYGS